MKKGIVLLTALGSLLLLGSCNNETTTGDAAPVENQETTTALPENHTDHDHAHEEGATQVVGSGTQENPYAHLTGNNPAHGQPNHRCDIPEGAPLNSPPGTGAQPVVTPAGGGTSPVSVQPAAQPPQQTAPGFSGKANPAHGEPGHRCDLDVGAILP